MSVMERFRLSNQVIALGGVAIGLLFALAMFRLAVVGNDPDIVIYNDPTAGQVVVEIRGQVAIPGVYRLSEDARLVDLIDQAGGTLADADLAHVNRARRLEDAEVVVIPVKGAATPVLALIPGTPVSSNSLSFRININTASQLELESLPGIGPVIASRIIDYRETKRPFSSVDELSNIEGISQSLVAEIANLITVGP